MEINRLSREADELIRKVVARYNTLYTSTGKISQLELDLILDDLRQLYEKFKIIGHMNIQHQQEQLKAVNLNPTVIPDRTSVTESDPEPESKPEPDISAAVQTDPLPKETTPDIPVKEEIIAEVVPEKQETEPVPPAIPAAIDEVPSNPSHTLADKFKSDHKSLSDVISSGSQKEGSLGTRLGNVHITDLKSVIGLAEKFAFINELFGGDPLAYEKAIVQLNGSSHLNEAETYLGTLRLNHKWPADSPLVSLLYEMVRRKFNL
ncbi:MAG: hypothetical protein IPH84_08265 [Bacteroidales bacterium]|nr:hypothetical protein [Bacteroidales bacterium]